MASGSQKVTTYSSNTLIPKLNSASLSNFTDSQNLIYTYYGGDNSIDDKPISVDAFGVMSFKTASGWYGQLLMSSNNATGLYWRTATSLSGGWHKLLDSSNYTDYTVTKTGSGASGTWSISISGNAATATRINGNLAAATSDVNRNIWVSSTASADGIPNYISGFNMNPSTKIFTVPAGTRISPSAGSLYLGNSGNQGWVYVQDMCSQDGQKWKISQNGNAVFTGQLYINYDADVGLNQSGSLVIGAKDGGNIGIDGNEIMARSNGAASTLYLNSEGGNVYIGSGGITSVGTIVSSAGYLRSTANGNTVNIGSQNSGWCHIYNSASIPFIFNNTVCTTTGDLGTASYPFDNLILKSGGRVSGNGGNLYIGNSNNANWVLTQDICSHNGTGDTYWSLRITGVAHFKTAYGAVWNDYAEMRNVPKAQIDIYRIYDDKGEIERNYPYAGHCVYEIGDGTMELTNARLAKGCKIISDTFGFCIGETEDCRTPIAVTGRVLAYPYENIEEYKNHIGDCVCSGPNGTISIMTLEETIQHPECIVGTISEIPTYAIWRCGNKDTKPINVNGRIWIYVH